ncbi:MAG TPA: energy-coupling factor transporter ATPase [Clostridiales bacterium]|jgi:energy-coupling factor transport system ATP-binding protein|nr:energy-coupling factor transporter ATPase [Clostridiales bacterium]
MSLIEVKNVKYAYNYGSQDAIVAVNDVSFGIEEGEFVALVGHNGSGKSTLAKMLNGLIIPLDGDVLIDGMNTRDDSLLYDIRRQIGVVFQNPDNQMVATIIEDDIAFGPENLGLDPKEIRERVDWALGAVGMEKHKKGMPFRLSGGQKQRVAIAGVLAIKPRVLVLDESTSMLDPKGRTEVLNVIKRLNKEENITVVLITHYMDEATDADRIIILNKGKIAHIGGKEIFLEEDRLRSYGLNVPTHIHIANSLRQGGMDIGQIWTERELEEEICRLL